MTPINTPPQSLLGLQGAYRKPTGRRVLATSAPPEPAAQGSPPARRHPLEHLLRTKNA